VSAADLVRFGVVGMGHRGRLGWIRNLRLIEDARSVGVWYTPHSLVPLLRATEDRVTAVTCMATRPKSYYYEQEHSYDVPLPELDVALMRTEKDVISTRSRISSRAFNRAGDRCWTSTAPWRLPHRPSRPGYRPSAGRFRSRCRTSDPVRHVGP